MSVSQLPNQQAYERSHTGKLLAIIAVLLVLCLVVAVLFPALLRAKRRPTRPLAQHAMQQMGLTFKMYANESDGNRYPRLASNLRVWAPDLSEIYPEYMTESAVLVSSGHPNCDAIRTTMYYVLDDTKPDYETAAGLMGISFAYLGYAVKDEAGFEALAEARRRGLLDGSGDPGQEAMVLPLREGIERFFITDINGPPGPIEAAIRSTIPVLVEIAAWKHKAAVDSFPGAHVLYLDGHVQYVPPGKFPVVPWVMDVLSGIAPDESE